MGETIFYLAILVAATAGTVYLFLLVWMLVASIRNAQVRRPALVNYAALAFGLAMPTMIIGLVLWGRLPWWFVLLFAPFAATRLVLFKAGQSVSRRKG
ncbi:MAG TPA: hypothetical protein VGB34_05695 [Candidatus Limnocylindria bacterium]|jgi:hypothetical protein